MSQIGDKRSDTQWLNEEREDPVAFGQILAGKLGEYTSTALGPLRHQRSCSRKITTTEYYSYTAPRDTVGNGGVTISAGATVPGVLKQYS